MSFGRATTVHTSSVVQSSTVTGATSTLGNVPGAALDSSQDIDLPSPPTDTVSALSWSSQGDFLAASSWDNSVRVWQATYAGMSSLLCHFNLDAPVLTCRWNADGTKILAACADNTARLLDPTNNQIKQIAQHDAPVSGISAIDSNVIVTGSWDKSLRAWDMRTSAKLFSLDLGERIYSMDFKKDKIVAATADKGIKQINIQNPHAGPINVECTLRNQLRYIKLFPDANGFVASSIEGRITVQTLLTSVGADRDNFAFKCHRDDQTPPNAYPIHCLDFHPITGTLASCGGDGSFAFWDKNVRQRIKVIKNAANNVPITSCAFNRIGNIFAYSASYDWSRGHASYAMGSAHRIRLHPIVEGELIARKKATK